MPIELVPQDVTVSIDKPIPGMGSWILWVALDCVFQSDVKYKLLRSRVHNVDNDRLVLKLGLRPDNNHDTFIASKLDIEACARNEDVAGLKSNALLVRILCQIASRIGPDKLAKKLIDIAMITEQELYQSAVNRAIRIENQQGSVRRALAMYYLSADAHDLDSLGRDTILPSLFHKGHFRMGMVEQNLPLDLYAMIALGIDRTLSEKRRLPKLETLVEQCLALNNSEVLFKQMLHESQLSHEGNGCIEFSFELSRICPPLGQQALNYVARYDNAAFSMNLDALLHKQNSDRCILWMMKNLDEGLRSMIIRQQHRVLIANIIICNAIAMLEQRYLFEDITCIHKLEESTSTSLMLLECIKNDPILIDALTTPDLEDNWVQDIERAYLEKIKAIKEYSQARRKVLLTATMTISESEQQLRIFVIPTFETDNNIATVQAHFEAMEKKLHAIIQAPTLSHACALLNSDIKTSSIQGIFQQKYHELLLAYRLREADLMVAEREIKIAIKHMASCREKYTVQFEKIYTVFAINEHLKLISTTLYALSQDSNLISHLKLLGSERQSQESQQYRDAITRECDLTEVRQKAGAAIANVEENNRQACNLLAHSKLEKHVMALENKITEFKLKMTETHEQKYQDAHDAAEKLFKQLSQFIAQFRTAGIPPKESLRQFKQDTASIIHHEDIAVLKEHRSPYLHLFRKIGIAIGALLTGGILLIPAIKYGWFATQSAREVNRIEEDINNISSFSF